MNDKELNVENLTIYEKLHFIQLELKAKKSQWNDFSKFHYRSLEDILEALKPLLDKYLCIVVLDDKIEAAGERIYIKSTASIQCLKTGESKSVSAYAREALNQKGMNDSQLTGSTSSYARKYAMNGLFLIDDSSDIDAFDNHTSHQSKNKATQSRNNTTVAFKNNSPKATSSYKPAQGISKKQIERIEAVGEDFNLTDYIQSCLDKRNKKITDLSAVEADTFIDALLKKSKSTNNVKPKAAVS